MDNAGDNSEVTDCEASNAPLVSIVVPAFNAAVTLVDTLDSVLGQTHRRIEVIVVDDGSIDGTADIVRRRAARDPRLRLVSTPNRGVAAARNRGAAETSGRFIACIDADDVWHPTMVEKCLAALTEAGPRAGFCYAFFRSIDGDGRMLNSCPPRPCAGLAFNRLLMNNFVGNGSGMVLRREAFEAVGGYDVSLRADGMQGAEDWQIQSLIALRWEVAVVPEYLVGYRRGRGTMSDDTLRMHRSMVATLRRIAAAAPTIHPCVLRYAEAALHARISIWSLRRWRMGAAALSLLRAIRLSPPVVWAVLRYEGPRRAGRLRRRLAAGFGLRRRATPPCFADMDTRAGVAPLGPHFLDAWISRHPEPAAPWSARTRDLVA